MIRWYYFLVIVLVIFLAERLLPATGLVSISLFPLFAIILLLRSQNYVTDFWRVVISGLIFDGFSGFGFGFLTLIIFLLGLTIYLARNELAISQRSWFSSLTFFILFVIEYQALFLLKSPRHYLIASLPAALAYSLIFYWLLTWVLKKTTNDIF